MTSFLDVTQSPCVYYTLPTARSTLTYSPVIEYRRLDDDSELTFGQWTAALHLATMWSFDDIRERIIEQVDKRISEADPIDRIEASLKCRVEKWLHPAYEVLCKREIVLSDAEAERLGLRRTMAIWRVRESLRPIQNPTPPQPVPQADYFGVYSPGIPLQFVDMEIIPEISNVVRSGATALDLIKKEEALKFS